MIQVKVGDEENVNRFGLQTIKEGKAIQTIITWMDTAIEEDRRAAKFN
jgi:hypothetical protein